MNAWNGKWKYVVQTIGLVLSALAAAVLLLPLGMTKGLPAQIAGVVFCAGAVTDIVILLARTPTNSVTAKWLGMMMGISLVINIIGALILFFPLLQTVQLALIVAGVIAVIDTLFEGVELIKI